MKANSDESGAYADLFELADQYANGKLALDAAKVKIRASLPAQQEPMAAQVAR